MYPMTAIMERDKNAPKWTFPSIFKIYWCVQFIGWLQVSMFSLYFTSFVGVEIFGGNPRATNYKSSSFDLFMNGVRYAAMAWVCCGMAGTGFSFILPYVNNFFGTLPVYVCGELGTSILIIGLCTYENGRSGMGNLDYLLYIGLLLYGVMTQIHYNNYWVLVELYLHEESQENKRAQVVQIFNLSIILPSIAIGFFGGLVLQLFNGAFGKAIAFWATLGLILNLCVFTYMWFTRHTDKKEISKDKIEAKTEENKHVPMEKHITKDKQADEKANKRKRIEHKMNEKIKKLELKIQKLENKE